VTSTLTRRDGRERLVESLRKFDLNPNRGLDLAYQPRTYRTSADLQAHRARRRGHGLVLLARPVPSLAVHVGETDSNRRPESKLLSLNLSC
jgi:hypothetical protein